MDQQHWNNVKFVPVVHFNENMLLLVMVNGINR